MSSNYRDAIRFRFGRPAADGSHERTQARAGERASAPTVVGRRGSTHTRSAAAVRNIHLIIRHISYALRSCRGARVRRIQCPLRPSRLHKDGSQPHHALGRPPASVRSVQYHFSPSAQATRSALLVWGEAVSHINMFLLHLLSLSSFAAYPTHI